MTMSFSNLIGHYDAYIIDQWGVLHDGKTPYPGVSDCLKELKAAGKQLILLSNSSKRKRSSFKGLKKVGIDPNAFAEIVTSGELAWHIIHNRAFDFTLYRAFIPPEEKLKVFVVGNNDDDVEYISTSGCQAATPEEADFVLARGTFNFVTSTENLATGVVTYAKAEDLMDAVEPWLQRCIARKLPMLVSNPDFHRPGSGAPMPGQIAKLYVEKYGGLVQYLGKPYQTVYDACFTVLEGEKGSSNGLSLDKSRICGVGDSLDHDILGAHTAGIAR